MARVLPFLWFDAEAEEAVAFYRQIFPDFEVLETLNRVDGRFHSAIVRFAGTTMTFMNSGPGHPFTDAISLFIDCDDQAEVDHYWNALVEGGEPHQGGRLTDKYGLHWLVIPKALTKYLQDPDRNKIWAITQAMLKMKKIIVRDLDTAYEDAPGGAES